MWAVLCKIQPRSSSGCSSGCCRCCSYCCCKTVAAVWNWLHNVNIPCLNSADDPAEGSQVHQPFLVATTSIRLVRTQEAEAPSAPPAESVDHWLRRQSRHPQAITAQLSDILGQLSVADSIGTVIEEAKVIRSRHKRLMKMTRPPRPSLFICFKRLRRRCGIFFNYFFTKNFGYSFTQSY